MRVNNKLILSAFLAANFLIAPAAALADGYPDTGPEAQAQIKKAVKKASIKKPVKKKAASKPKKQVIKRAVLTPVRKTSLERGKELMNQHRYEEARPWLQKAVQEQRKSAEAWYLYGLYHERTGRFAEAQYFYTKAVQIDPLFDPLSRIMTYPNDTKTALWDKKRPGRVYEIPTMTRSGTIIPPNSPQASRLPARPDAQNNPVVPKVPVYTPPEPGAAPNDGDAWSPSVYVPPSPNNNNNQVYMPPRANNLNSGGQVYTPPSANNNFEPDRELELEAEAENTSSVVYNPPLPVIYEQSNSEAAYNPPAPEVKAASSSSNSKKAAKAPAKKQAARAKARTNSKSRAKRAANNNQQAQAARQNNSQAQQAQARSQNNSQAQARQQTRQAPQAQARPQNNSQRVRINELPPVGQTTNNGTFEVPLPPVGQR